MAMATAPAANTTKLMTTRSRPTLGTNRPANGAPITDPSASAVTARPDSRAEKPRPSWKYNASTSGRPVYPQKYNRARPTPTP